MKKYDDAMEMIAHAARYKMLLNSHKGDIETVPLKAAISMLNSEIEELVRAYGKGDWEKVIVEAGDVMNFLTGIVHQAMTQYRTRKMEKENAANPA